MRVVRQRDTSKVFFSFGSLCAKQSRGTDSITAIPAAPQGCALVVSIAIIVPVAEAGFRMYSAAMGGAGMGTAIVDFNEIQKSLLLSWMQISFEDT